MLMEKCRSDRKPQRTKNKKKVHKNEEVLKKNSLSAAQFCARFHLTAFKLEIQSE